MPDLNVKRLFVLLVVLGITFRHSEAKAIKTFRGIENKIGHETNQQQFNELTCRRNCQGSFDLCDGITNNFDEQMVCLKAKLLCRLKCVDKQDKVDDGDVKIDESNIGVIVIR